jgi:hypothetical protein
MSTTTKGQIEIDWSKAPTAAKEAILEIHWLDHRSDKFGWDVIAQYDRPPTVAHPHAEIMAKYAEVAARRVDPWVEFEYKAMSGDIWEELTSNPSWHTIREYRHIGDNK